MKTLLFTLSLLIISPTLFGQSMINVTDSDFGNQDVTWTNDNIYLLTEMIFVKPGTKLTIEPGTVIKGAQGTGNSATGLVVSVNAQIFAEGTVENPIIMTSELDDLKGSLSEMDRGLWGGLLLYGNSPTNDKSCSANEGIFEFLVNDIPSWSGYSCEDHHEYIRYGGDSLTVDEGDNSGILKFISIRHAGTPVGDIANYEPPGLAIAGIGSKTIISNIEVFASARDGFGFFGGTVNTKYLVSAFNSDDLFDWDNGFRGEHQFWFGIQKVVSLNEGYGRALEMDGSNRDENHLPFAHPIISNATILGPGIDLGANGGDGYELLMFRDNTGGELYNSIFSINPNRAITIQYSGRVEGFDAKTRLAEGDLILQNNLWYGFGVGNTIAEFASGEDQGHTRAYLKDEANGNLVADPLFRSISRSAGSNELDPRPAENSPALITSNVKRMEDLSSDFLENVNYIGAFSGESIWARRWTALDDYEYFNDTIKVPEDNNPPAIPSYIPQDSLVAWYPFNGNANDESGNGNNGTVNGATLTTDKDGNENSAYSFNGLDNWVTLPNSLELNDVDGGVTLSLWFNASSLDSSTSYLLDLTDGSANDSWGDRIVLSLRNGNYFAGGHFDNNIDLSYPIENEPTASQSPFEWRNYTVVYNWESSSISQYVDGLLLEDQGSLEGSFNVFLSGGNDGSRKIGARAHSQDPTFHWHGHIDDIAIWNRALTDDEIRNIYYEGEVPIKNDNNNNVVWKKLISSDDFPERLGFQTYAFDKAARKIYFLNVKEKSAYSFDIDKLEFESIDLTGYPSFDKTGDIIYNPENNTIQFWRAGTDDVFEFSVNGGQINKIGDGSYSSRMYGSNPIYNAYTKAPSIIFGYGWFNYSNAAYDLIDGFWKNTVENQSVEGIPYKRGTTIYPNQNYTKAYIIDGSGNKSGSQSENECSIENGLPWASDVGKWCWLRDLWEINLEDWSFKQILPLNSNFRYTGSFGYDYSNDLFYSFGGFIPQEVYGQEAIRSDSLFVYDPTKNTGWVSIEQDGDIPASDLNKVSYYDNVKNRFIIGATDGGIWELKLDESVVNLFSHVITLDTLQVRKDSSFTVSVHSSEIAPADSIESYQFVLPLSDGLTYTGYTTDSTHSTDGFISVNETDSTLNVAFASNVNLSGTKPLIHLNFDGVKAKDYYFTPEKVFYNNKAVPGVTGGLVGVVKKIGDVDNDGTIFAFDAAKALRYSVGLDALPKLDPLPWEYWRQRTADVNDDGMVLAVDAADILKYVVGTIEEFSSVKAKRMNPSVEVIARDGNLYFDSETNGLFGINVDLKVDQTISYGDPETPDGLMSAVNATDEQLKIGVASSEDITGRFLTVPITQYSGGDELGITYYINNVRTQYKVDMTEAMTDIEEELSVLPQQYELLQNYPNPFNPSTQIRYALPAASQVRLEVYNSVGQKVMVLVDGQQSAGYHQVSFNASGLSSGVYLYKLSTPGFSQTKKMLLIK